MNNLFNSKQKIIFTVAVITFLTTGCYADFANDNSENLKLDDLNITYQSIYDKNKDGVLSKEEAKKYLQDCQEYRDEYTEENYTEGFFGPFNFFGIKQNSYIKPGHHNIFDKNEIYFGNGLIDFNELDRMYREGNCRITEGYTHEIDSRLATTDMNTSAQGYYTTSSDKTIFFEMPNDETVVMTINYCPTYIGVTINKRNDKGESYYIRTMNFNTNDQSELTLFKESIQLIYKDENDTALSVEEDLYSKEPIINDTPNVISTRIYFRHNGYDYYITGPISNQSSLDNGKYSIRTNYTPTGICSHEVDYKPTSLASIQDIRLALISQDYEQAALYFQTLINEQMEPAKTFIITESDKN